MAWSILPFSIRSWGWFILRYISEVSGTDYSSTNTTRIYQKGTNGIFKKISLYTGVSSLKASKVLTCSQCAVECTKNTLCGNFVFETQKRSCTLYIWEAYLKICFSYVKKRFELFQRKALYKYLVSLLSFKNSLSMKKCINVSDWHVYVTLCRRVTQYGVVEDLNFLHASLCM